MKNVFFLLFFLTCFRAGFAQKQKADSLSVLLAKEKKDSLKVKYMWQIASYRYSYAPDSAIRIAQQAVFLSQHIKYAEGESRSLGQMANGFLSLGNYPRALEYYLKKLKLEEKNNNAYNLASVTMNIGIVYVYREEYPKALFYLRKADSIITVNKIKDLDANIKLNIGDVFNRQHLRDSAFAYFGTALKVAIQTGDNDLTGAAMTGLGHTYLQDSNYAASQHYYLAALHFLEMANDDDLICETALGISTLHRALNQKDSAIHYALYSYGLAKKGGFLSRQLDAVELLTEIYKDDNDKDSAYSYLQQVRALEDSINSKDRIRESQNITINEQLRQDEMKETARRAKEERAQELQLMLIGICIPALFLFTVFLNKIRVPIRIIRFLGVISLLILFEYLTLLLHPMVLNITHHTPLLELLIFVMIAAMLIPAHHHLEHWLIEKLTFKKHPDPDGKFRIKKQKIKIKRAP